MKKRLMIGLLAGGLLAAMVPGVATATPGNEDVWNTGMCVAKFGQDRAANPATGDGPGVILGGVNGDYHDPDNGKSVFDGIGTCSGVIPD
jgi:hypothetical protein